MRELSSKNHEVRYFNYEQALILSKYCLEINKKVYLVVLSNVDEIHNGFSKQWQELKVEKILKGSLGPGFDPIMHNGENDSQKRQFLALGVCSQSWKLNNLSN